MLLRSRAQLGATVVAAARHLSTTTTGTTAFVAAELKEDAKQEKEGITTNPASPLSQTSLTLGDHEALAVKANLPWRLVSAAIVERLPVVTADKEQWELDMEEVQARKNEYGRTVPDNFLKDRSGKMADFQKDFVPAPRVTEEEEDARTTNKKLTERLYLVAQKSRNAHAWQFPQGGRDGEENMREVSGDLLYLFGIGKLEFIVAFYHPTTTNNHKRPKKKTLIDD
jgi:hypothetical protein